MSLIAWWPLNGHAKNMGLTAGTIQGTASNVTYTNGKLGSSMYTGSMSLSSDQGKSLIGNTRSIAMWIYTRDDGSYSAGVPFFGMDVMAAPNNRKFSMFHYNTKTNLHCSWQNDNSNSTYGSCHYSNFFELNTGVHLCIVQDAATDTITVYRNGTQYSKDTVNGLSSMNFKEAGAAPIRANIDYQHTNDIRIYDHALSAKEVKDLSRGLVSHYNFNNMSGEEIFTSLSNYTNCSAITNGVRINGSSSQPDTYFGIGPYGMSGGIPSNTEFLLTFNCSGLTIENQLAFYVSNLKNGPVYIKNGYNEVRFNTGASGDSSKRLFLDNTGNSALTGQNFTMTNFSLQKIDKASDVSGYNRDATSNALTFSNNAAIGDRSALFNGSTSCINIPVIKTDMFTSAYTLNFWTYPTDNGRAIFFGDHQIDNTVSTINFERKDGGAFRYYHNGSPDKTVSNLTTPINTGTMVTVTYTPGTMKFYKNGTLVETYSHTATISKKNGGIMRIGRDSRTDATALGGMIDDFRFYVTCLDEETIRELYSTRGAANKLGQVFSGLVNEGESKHHISKTGVVNCNTLNEVCNIPDGYTLITYVESTGSSYINTGVAPGTNLSFEIIVSHVSNNAYILTQGNYGLRAYSSTFTNFVSGKRFRVTSLNISGSPMFYIKGSNNGLEVNNVLGTQESDNDTPSGNAMIMKSGSGKIYGCNIGNGDQLVRCFVPVKRNSDNITGLYDGVSKQFFFSATSTAFTTSDTKNSVVSFNHYGHLHCNEFNEI